MARRHQEGKKTATLVEGARDARRPDWPVAEKALAYAKEFQGKDEAVDFLMMVVNLDQQRARPALETLLKDHIDNPKLSEMSRADHHLDRIVSPEFAEEAPDEADEEQVGRRARLGDVRRAPKRRSKSPTSTARPTRTRATN